MLQEKQLEIIERVFIELKIQYSVIELGTITYRTNETWVDLLMPDELIGDENLDDMIAEKGTDILLDYGYAIMFHTMPIQKKTALA